MVADPTSQFLFVVSQNSSQVFGFRINGSQGTLSALNPANMSTGSLPIALAMHSTGMFLFVSNNGSSNISSFNVDTTSGALSSPLTVTTVNAAAGRPGVKVASGESREASRHPLAESLRPLL